MKDTNPHLIVVAGPTAAGKTGLAVALARQLGTEIINADSRQFYREMAIGTARPTAGELAAVPHHFIADRSLREPLNAGEFARLAREKLHTLFEQHRYVIVSGGSNLFVEGLLHGFDEFPQVPDAVRSSVDSLFQEQGLPGLQKAVAAADPAYYAETDIHNPARLRRALEVYRASGQPYSTFRGRNTTAPFFTTIYLAAYQPRPRLYERIDQRVKQMMAEGLLAEATALYDQRTETALQTVGYQELFSYLDGTIDLPTAVELIQRNTRRYAKRQITWLRRDGFWRCVRPEDPAESVEYIDFLQTVDYRLATYRAATLGDKLLPVTLPKDGYLVAWETPTGQLLAGYVYTLGNRAQLGKSFRTPAATDRAVAYLRQEAERRVKR